MAAGANPIRKTEQVAPKTLPPQVPPCKRQHRRGPSGDVFDVERSDDPADGRLPPRSTDKELNDSMAFRGAAFRGKVN